MVTPRRISLSTTAGKRRLRGFTLLEVTIVVVILAILSSLMLPRLFGHEKRNFRLVTEQVADLLLMYAQRDALSPRPVGISHDAERNWITLVTLEASENRLLEGASTWQMDSFVRPVKLPPIGSRPITVEFRADGELVNAAEWPLASTPGRDRPEIDITLYTEVGLTATVSLSPYSVAPSIWGLDDEQTYGPEPMDLDATGRSREDW